MIINEEQVDQKINYQITGGGDIAVILIHGIPSSLDEWKFLAAQLAAAGYRSAALDLLGHGGSFHPESPVCYTVDAAYDYFDQWFSSLDINAPMILVGHSFGGHLAIRFALDHPDKVRAIVLIDPFLSFGQFSPIYRFFLSNPAAVAILYKLIPVPLIKAFVWWDNLRIERLRLRCSLSREERTAMAEDYKRCSPSIVYFPRSVCDNRFNYAEIKAPTLLIWGRNDHTLSTRWYRKIAALIPNCSFAILNAKHYPHRTNQPEVNRIILDFLKSNSI
ncbi:MAG: alpha/beta hydrolase [Anaerolineaceae bacterium]|nr:alpha/beta hydrolase [Anaerolineaceae bacterium]